ncbi:hypothetical protein B0H13DRAFT_2313325 [Mycena leptocephala]|nr:hypothetical protein B0H13DRAFT_2313325 [Mycena leptocephala]
MPGFDPASLGQAGLTALEARKTEPQAESGEELEDSRPGSSLSCHTSDTIHPSSASPSTVSLFSDDPSIFENVDISASIEQLLDNLRLTWLSEIPNATPDQLDCLEQLLRDAVDITMILSAHYHTITDEAFKEVQVLRKDVDNVRLGAMCNHVEQTHAALPSPISADENLDLFTEAWLDGPLRTSDVLHLGEDCQLDCIRGCIALAEHFITIVRRRAARVERVANAALKKRESAIAKLRGNVLSAKSTTASLTPGDSARSSYAFFDATFAAPQDDDTRFLRSFLLPKINTGVSVVQEQLKIGIALLRTVQRSSTCV